MADTVTITQGGAEIGHTQDDKAVEISQGGANVTYEETAPSEIISQGGATIIHEETSPLMDITQAGATIIHEDTTPEVVITQAFAEVAYIESVTPAPPVCYVADNEIANIASRFYVILKDTTGLTIALFDDWLSLEYGEEIDGVGYYKLTFMDNGDPRLEYFGLDYIIEIHKSVPGSNVPWFIDFVGLHRYVERNLTSDGVATFTSVGPCKNDFLARKIINYKAGTIQADKSDPAETVMKEYVNENIGPIATVATYFRMEDGVMPGITVDTDNALGTLWEGKRAFENVLKVLQDIANYSKIDFAMVYSHPAKFQFRTYVDQLGVDRTKTGLNSVSGLNTAGYPPVELSPDKGNIQEYRYVLDRLGERNVIVLLGKGDGSTRTVEVVKDPVSTLESPWNKIEMAVNVSNQEFQYQRYIAGWEALIANSKIENLSFKPLQQPSCLFSKHYFLGDKITLTVGTITRNKRLVAVRRTISDKSEVIEETFADIP